jgi:flagellar biosynthesis/type III secretory pathway protein FliH
MKLSSPEAAAARPAKLDRPLSGGALGSGLTDPRLQAGLAEAIEQARGAALAEGYAAGWALGSKAAAEQQATLPAWHEVADALADGALAIAAAALDRELRTVDAPVVEALKVALRALAGQEVVAIRLHPDDAAMLDPDVLPDGVRLVPDADVARGGVLAQTPAQRLLMHLPAALAAAEEVLRS